MSSPETSDGFANLRMPGVVNSLCGSLAQQGEKADADGAEAIATALISDAGDARATDIHIDSLADRVRLRFRIDGSIVHVGDLETWSGRRLIGFLKTHAGLDPAPALEPSDSHLDPLAGIDKTDLRLACAPCRSGEKLTLRLLRRDQASLKLSELGLSDDHIDLITRWFGDISGMVLVAGPTGSGKTTTLYSLLNELDLVESNVFTIEDPIEYQVEGINQLEVNRERGTTFAEGLRSSLRHDPDYILLGEIRDELSAQVALDAANIGHVILSTLHSRDAAGVVTTLRGFEVQDQEIASSVALVIAQRLVRRLCVECRETAPPSDDDVQWLESLGIEVPGQSGKPVGCDTCKDQGYRGRLGLFEVWPVDRRGYREILEHEDEQTLRKTLRDRGIPSLIEDGVKKAAKGLIQLSDLRQMGARSYLDQRDPDQTSAPS